MKRLITAALITAILAGCATPYQRISSMGGFSEIQLQENIFQVSFRGNLYTSRERAANFTLLRSAELALENGFSHFIIVESSQYSKLSKYIAPTTSHTMGNVTQFGNSYSFSATTQTYGGQTHIISKPGSTNLIVCFKGKPKLNGLIYDARFLYKSLSQKYGIKKNRKTDGPLKYPRLEG